MEYLTNHRKNISLICAIVSAFGFYFYWYQYRPAAIRQDCYQSVEATNPDYMKQVGLGDDSTRGLYDACLASKGL